MDKVNRRRERIYHYIAERIEDGSASVRNLPSPFHQIHLHRPQRSEAMADKGQIFLTEGLNWLLPAGPKKIYRASGGGSGRRHSHSCH